QVTSTIIEAQAPCQYDLPYTDTFPIYCQLNYHGAKYLCDPSGMMSRTEVDLLESSVSSLNLSSAFCQPHCGGKQLRVAVVLEDVASLHGLQSCSQSVSPLLIGSPRPPSLIAASLEFARLVNEHWDEAAPADLLIVLIKYVSTTDQHHIIIISTWHPSHLHRPIVVPYFTRRLARLSRYSVGMFISPRQTYLEALKETFAHVGKLLAKKEQITIIPKPTTVPRWVIYSTVALLALVIFSVRLANWVSRRMNRARKPKWNTHSYKADSRFRAGFAGGMMIRNEQSRKSTMMFRSFNKRNGIPTAQRI
ncbi:hypothetical protein PFISCL1PPCAC_8229, partial [Pristionchus fissidentatus]